MKITVSESQFRDAFQRRPDNFSYEGLSALFEYLEEYEDSTGEEIELDPIAICCEYAEYENLEEFQKDYGDDYNSIEEIEDHTQVIRIDDEAFILLV